MGPCLSSAAPKARRTSESEGSNPKAIVISENGDLVRFGLPMTVSQVLLALHSQAAKPGAKFFLCNSDCLYYDEFIPALDGDLQLQPNQIYFVLPASKLRYRLSASDMAALAVKASVALQNPSSPASNSKSKARRSSVFHYPHRLLHRHKKVAQISPLLEEVNITSSSSSTFTSSSGTLSESSTISTYLGVSRSIAPTRKKYLRRTSSIRRAKMAVRSFRLSLTTIHEGSVLQVY
ncbi:uncharacterized protein LOC127807225 [Diospyros lotus]|uniref:uncharacterized protein LOC127807225 n=1 Tax=Diospyros lotus TaxID=55363 RepID=UPI00224E7548|nr:uncharacterized protein LOC127807225 [Diospyros lotus]